MNTSQTPKHDAFVADRLTCIRGQRLVFTDLSFTIAPGCATVLRGPNGSGKSSLLRLVAGLLKPATGRMTWAGADVAADREFHRRQVRYVGHQDAVKPTLTVDENLRHWAAIYGESRPTKAAVRDALSTQDLTGLADLPARLLSAGQRRRLNLVRLVFSPGHLWLLDEPTVSLDAESVTRLETSLREHLDRKGSALIATHVGLTIGPHDTVELSPARQLDEYDA